MFWATVISTGLVLQISLQAAAYGAYPQTGNSPPRPARTSAQTVNQLFFWDHNRPELHGPQVDINANNFQPQGDTAPFGGGGGGFFRPSASENGTRRRPQQLKFRKNLILPPGADGPDDVFIFDRPTSPRPSGTRRTTTTTTSTTPVSTATTACNCPSTDEFNPVCGSDRVTYSNPGRLKCAQLCGTDVNIKHYGTCVTTSAPAITSTTPTTN